MALLIPISATTTPESNLILRAFWAYLRTEFGKLAWQFSPRKDGSQQMVYFGWADLGLGRPIRFGVHYKKKGIAESIVVEDTDAEAEARIQACATSACNAICTPPFFEFIFPVKDSLELECAQQSGERIAIGSSSTGQLVIELKQVVGFDQFDALAECHRRLRTVLDCMSFLTNLAFEILPQGIDLSERASSDGKIATEAPAPDWIEGCPLVGDLVVLSSSGIKLLDALCDDVMSESVSGVANAAHHFHTGLHLELRGLGRSTLDRISIEQAIVAYVSALETASLVSAPESHACHECGQVQYKISARVTDFVKKRVGGAAPDLVKRLYNSRSSYLHTGALLSSRSYTGSIIPQLDPSAVSGVLTQLPVVPLVNLREFTSYCLRSVAAECVV